MSTIAPNSPVNARKSSTERMEDIARRIKTAVEELPLGAKRRRSRDAIERWLPYYAGYSIEFADAVLRAASLSSTAVVHDPWNGSGTTTLAASRLGLKSTGIDLNPAAILVAKARLVNQRDASGAQGFVRRVANSCRNRAPTRASQDDPLMAWLSPRNVADFRFAQKVIIRELAASGPLSTFEVGAPEFPPLAAFLILSLICAARTIAKVRTSSNPSRHTLADASQSKSRASLVSLWPSVAVEMAVALPSLIESAVPVSIALGDARDATGRAAHADFVLTSPPYLTRLDYADATSFVLACLGTSRGSSAFEHLRRTLMGAPLVRMKEVPEVPDSWPPSIASLLSQVRSHPSKASESYYYKTYWQYFQDARLSLRALRESMKPGSFGALVVQTSYYKNIRVDLPALYVDLATSEGLSSTIAVESPVKTVISSIHPGTKAYRGVPDYRESVVLVQRRACG